SPKGRHSRCAGATRSAARLGSARTPLSSPSVPLTPAPPAKGGRSDARPQGAAAVLRLPHVAQPDGVGAHARAGAAVREGGARAVVRADVRRQGDQGGV